jgi:predicted NACHT family NTPase
LILGDPGAGKSTSLRKLAKELLKELPATRRIPIYVNLKEWKQARQCGVPGVF